MARAKKRRQWGDGEVHQQPSGFQIRWRENGRRKAKGGIPTREEADRLLAKIKGDIAQGLTGLLPDPRGVPTLGELGDAVIERRKATNRSGGEDASRWKKHLVPYFGGMRPGSVDTSTIRQFVEMKLREEHKPGITYDPATIRIMVALLSAVYADLLERRIVAKNPCRGLPDSLMRLMRSTFDPRTTPFIEKIEDVRRVYLALPAPLDTAYAIGALAGLRTGEVFALRWRHVDLAARRIHVRESVKGPLKDDDSRMVPVLDALLPILRAWKLQHGSEGRVIPPLRLDGKKISKGTPGPHLARVLDQLQLARPRLGWYEATRHTFASQWVMAGGSIEKLSVILGHYSVVMTERYAHLKPELFTKIDLGTIAVNMAGTGALAGTIGHEIATDAGKADASSRN